MFYYPHWLMSWQQEEAAVLIESMLEHNGIELLVHRLTSLTESAGDDEGKAVFNTLSIFENMIEVKPEVQAPARHWRQT